MTTPDTETELTQTHHGLMLWLVRIGPDHELESVGGPYLSDQQAEDGLVAVLAQDGLSDRDQFAYVVRDPSGDVWLEVPTAQEMAFYAKLALEDDTPDAPAYIDVSADSYGDAPCGPADGSGGARSDV